MSKKTKTKKEEKNKYSYSFGKPNNVILFNDDVTPMDVVVVQITKATRCSPEKAYKLMLEAHKNGRAIVFTGYTERCEHVASVLEQVGLGVKIEPV